MRTAQAIFAASLLCISRVGIAAGDEKHILFIGNSLTAANDLPQIVCRLAAVAGRNATCEAVAPGGYSLDDHLLDGTATRRIRAKRWSIVVLQQGPSARDESRVALRRAAQTLAVEAHKAGARPALYAPWPWKSRSVDFPRVAESYRLAAGDVDGLLFRAGDTWQTAWRRDPGLPLYGDDDFHPSVTGSYLAALVIYAGIYGDLPASFAERSVAEKAAGNDLKISVAQLRVLLQAALASKPTEH